ncbi:hypothetical protein [Kordiimonas sp.]|uniref:hypothetical protein n=1 Tax=Kordiimonas sp. TaxID=1970157 RepID=UPI003A8D0776
MPKYKVHVPYIATVTATVEADDEESAIEAALQESQPSQLVGNGGYDKLIGVSNTNEVTLSIECGEGEIEGEIKLAIEVEEIKDAESA